MAHLNSGERGNCVTCPFAETRHAACYREVICSFSGAGVPLIDLDGPAICPLRLELDSQAGREIARTVVHVAHLRGMAAALLGQYSPDDQERLRGLLATLRSTRCK